MKRLLILSILITLAHSNNKKGGFLEAGKKTVSLLRDYINTGKHLNKYLEKKSVKDEFDAQIAKSKAKVVKRARKSAKKFNKDDEVSNFLGNGKYQSNRLFNGYHVDSVLNEMRRRYVLPSYEDSNSRSSSRELKDWKTEWKELWMRKKIEAWNATTPSGDIVNMVAARPWGVPCGDPSQHDMPWGTCVLPVECDAEYRIYRGDYFCGRTHFVCCSLYFSTYDTYQGFDVSLQDSALQTDSAEFREKKKQASREALQKKLRDRRRRKRVREERKRKIRRTIQRIVREVRRILNRAYRNGTRLRRKKTKTMKKFIRYLKQQYRKDRDSAKDIHEHQMWEVDSNLMSRLLEIKEVNDNFMTNDTFRNIILNRTMSPNSARMLVEAYPQLSAFINGDILRRVGIYKLPNEDARVRTDVGKDSARLGNKTHQSGDAMQPGGHTTPPSRDAMRRKGDVFRRNRDALRRSLDALQRTRDATRRSGYVTRPYRRRRKNRDYDIEYGLLYS